MTQQTEAAGIASVCWGYNKFADKEVLVMQPYYERAWLGGYDAEARKAK